ncbi:hypothetical protein AVEN_29821-1, partial [Araneus ventricosus]
NIHSASLIHWSRCCLQTYREINFLPSDFEQSRTNGSPKVPSRDYTAGGPMKTSQPRSNNFRWVTKDTSAIELPW